MTAVTDVTIASGVPTVGTGTVATLSKFEKAASTGGPAASDVALAVTIRDVNANGTTTDANSTPVAWSTEGKAQVGSLTETAPASDTASSGLNGRLQRIAQNITTLISATLKAALQTTIAGGSQVLRKIDLNSTAVAVKASAGQVYGFFGVNRSTSPRYLRFYNVASGSVTVGTTAPLIGPIEIPANANDHTAFFVNISAGIEFTTAISMAATTGFADNDTGAPTANDVLINVLYK